MSTFSLKRIPHPGWDDAITYMTDYLLDELSRWCVRRSFAVYKDSVSPADYKYVIRTMLRGELVAMKRHQQLVYDIQIECLNMMWGDYSPLGYNHRKPDTVEEYHFRHVYTALLPLVIAYSSDNLFSPVKSLMVERAEAPLWECLDKAERIRMLTSVGKSREHIRQMLNPTKP